MKIQDSNPASVSSPSAKLIRLYPSSYHVWLMSLVHVCVLLAIVISAIPWWLQSLLLPLIVLSYWYFIRQWQQYDVLRLQYLHKRWCLYADNTPQPKYHIVNWSFWARWLLVIEVRDEQGKRHHLPLFCDCCTADEFRWLRVIIKYYL